MELRHIRYFLAVAEEGNFTRAAARLGIGQPPLSLQIRDLEAEAGVQLFHRVPHGAELTAAGRAFRDQVQAIPGRVAEAVRAAQRASRGETGQLSFGVTGTAVLNPVVSASIRNFRRSFPDVELKLTEANSATLAASLQDGQLDIAILRLVGDEPADLKIQKLVDETLTVALPASHPAAKAGARGDLDLMVLKDEPLIVTPRGLHDAALRACRAAGFEPVQGQPAPQIASILSLVAAELGFALVPAALRPMGVEGVVYRSLRAPVPRTVLAVAYRAERPARPVENFAAIARVAARAAKEGAKPR